MKRVDLNLKNKYIFLSYALDTSTPTYGNKDSLEISQNKVTMSAHMGTHIDFPNHFFEGAASICDYSADFFIFAKPLVVEIKPKSKIIQDELILSLDGIRDDDYDILLVKTGGCKTRGEDGYALSGYGFAPEIAIFLREKYPKIRVFGFDTISVSSFLDRELGRAAHKAFLNPDSPILLLEDMDLREIGANELKSIFVSPLRIGGFDGAPCVVIGEFVD